MPFGKTPRILLVEDHLPLAALRRALLVEQGYAVACATDCQQGSQLLQEQEFDLVLTDSELPQGSGLEVAAAAKRKHLPVVMISGRRVTPAMAAALRHLVDYVAPKPCSGGQLLALIKTALAKSLRSGTKRP